MTQITRNRIDLCFHQLAQESKKAFIAYITAGDPNLETTVQIAKTLAESGVDMLELGIPFSDPIADGLVIQLASQRALEAGTTPQAVLETVKNIRNHTSIPIILFTYYNPIFKYGFEAYVKKAAQVGVDGFLLLDLPTEEAAEEKKLVETHGMKWIGLIAPTTPSERISQLTATTSGFIYYVSREGVTGMQTEVAASLSKKISEIRTQTNLPISVGFGISNVDHVRQVARVADGIVVGSAIVKQIEQFNNKPDLLKHIKQFVQPLTDAAHQSLT